MDRLILSGMGFRAENCARELVSIKERQPYNPLVLETARDIVDYYDMLTHKEESKILGIPAVYSEFLFDDKPEEKIEAIRKTKLTLEKIAKKEEVQSNEFDLSINFFQELSNKCLEYLGANRQI